jgi:hypothetical protein
MQDSMSRLLPAFVAFAGAAVLLIAYIWWLIHCTRTQRYRYNAAIETSKKHAAASAAINQELIDLNREMLSELRQIKLALEGKIS